MYWIVISLVVVALALAGCSLFEGSAEPTPESTNTVPTVTAESAIISEGRVVPRLERTLVFQGVGEVAEVLVKSGDTVEAGQVLARLANREQAEAALSTAELELESAQLIYDDLIRLADLAHAQAWQALIQARAAHIAASRVWEAIDTDETQQEIDDADVAVADAKTVLDDAQETFDQYEDLPEDNDTRTEAVDELEQAQLDYDEAVRKRDELVNARDKAQADLLAAQAAEAEAQRTFDQSESGPDPDQLTLAEARLANANAQVAAAQAALNLLELKAPFAGAIADVNIIPGQVVSSGTWAFVLADFSEWYVETTDLTEMEIVKVFEGQAVSLVPDAVADLELEGEVVEISQVAGVQSGDVVYTVRILLKDPDPRLRWGMTVEASFLEN
jgi:multidrug efflux pump subunit AcrA (membrane-fusion protein)